MAQPTLVIGDVHGQVDQLRVVLRGADLIDTQDRWAGGTARLWFTGDFVDRGPDGIGVIDLVMALQQQARAAGGEVGAVLGNHDLLLLAADRFGAHAAPPGGTLWFDWVRNGGQRRDLQRMTDEHRRWLAALPTLVRIEDALLAHADAMFYLHYGRTVAEINAAVAAILAGNDLHAWDELAVQFAERQAFSNEGLRSARRLQMLIGRLGARTLVHGHTPISYVLGVDPAVIVEPYMYQQGRCINVDGGLYLGGAGFVAKILPGDQI